jgi:pimeloyl-ACP methyl ester carboxylesterase
MLSFMNADTMPAFRLADGIALIERGPAADLSRRPPLVLVHGGMHGAWAWADIQECLAGWGWRSVAFDWLSHGNSRKLPKDEWVRRGLTEVAQDIEVACASVEDAGLPPVLVAHSMGGLSALAYAATTSRPLHALVLLTPVVPSQFGGDPIPLPVEESEPFDPFPPELARQMFYDRVDDEQAARYWDKLQPESPAAVLQATRWTANVDVSGLSVPTLVVAAEKDMLVPAPLVVAMGKALGARVLELPGAGHGVELNPGWEALMDEITAWVESLPA